MKPIIFCTNGDNIASYIEDYSILNINELLSKNLIKYEQGKRSMFITDEFNKIIDSFQSPILLKNFEILFDPTFQIDVIKLFIMANRKKAITVLWCGTYKNGKLRFAEPGYEDYKSYDINNYDISCIV